MNCSLHRHRLGLLVVLGLVVSLLLSSHGCRRETPRELLVYCGITMIKPMREIADIFEKREGVKVVFTYGGSGNLLDAITVNRAGDLYLPGSDAYIRDAREKKLVSETAPVGANRAALMVQKGNPRGITADLNNLASPDYYVVIGNPESGSIGRETRRILKKKGIYDAVVKNARALTTDSKDLGRLLKDREADLVVNWYAAGTWPEFEPYVDAWPIDPELASPKRLVLGLLTTSVNPDLARRFMQLATSPRGRAIFARFGLSESLPAGSRVN